MEMGFLMTYKAKYLMLILQLKQKGMGIGLKLTKRFIESINGNLYLLNSKSSGTTFKITIPKLIKQ